jgi:hypothetical protein
MNLTTAVHRLLDTPVHDGEALVDHIRDVESGLRHVEQLIDVALAAHRESHPPGPAYLCDDPVCRAAVQL